MDAAAIRAVEHACTDLVNRYAFLMDFGPAIEGVDLFTETATLIHHTGQPFTGADTLRELFAGKDSALRKTLHVMSNIIITVVDEDVATGSAIFTLYDNSRDTTDQDEPMALDGPTMIGTYADRFVRNPAGWRFEIRDIDAVFARR